MFLAAARVGGIVADNATLVPGANSCATIWPSRPTSSMAPGATGCVNSLFLGSSCTSTRSTRRSRCPKDCLLSGPLEPTNQWYAIAKIAGLKMCQAYRRQYGFNALAVMPTNLYGPGDNFSLRDSHVLPALLRKFHEAKERGEPAAQIWGSGTPRREFLHVDDLADACLFLMQR